MQFGEKTTEADASRIIHQVLDAGVSLIDAAHVYAGGESSGPSETPWPFTLPSARPW